MKPEELELIKDNNSDDKLSIQEKYFNKLLDERMDEIPKMSDEVNLNNSTYYFLSPNLAPIKFIDFRVH